MELTTLIKRTQQIRDALPLPNVKQRLAAAAQELSTAGDNQTRVELLNEALLRFTTLVYSVDSDGVPAHIDRRTWRIMAAKPWGSVGWKSHNLRSWEATVLRKILQIRCQQGRVLPLFDYGNGQWYLNYQDYPRLDLALLYWKKQPVTLAEWRPLADDYRQRAYERVSKNRSQP